MEEKRKWYPPNVTPVKVHSLRLAQVTRKELDKMEPRGGGIFNKFPKANFFIVISRRTSSLANTDYVTWEYYQYVGILESDPSVPGDFKKIYFDQFDRENAHQASILHRDNNPADIRQEYTEYHDDKMWYPICVVSVCF